MQNFLDLYQRGGDPSAVLACSAFSSADSNIKGVTGAMGHASDLINKFFGNVITFVLGLIIIWVVQDGFEITLAQFLATLGLALGAPLCLYLFIAGRQISISKATPLPRKSIAAPVSTGRISSAPQMASIERVSSIRSHEQYKLRNRHNSIPGSIVRAQSEPLANDLLSRATTMPTKRRVCYKTAYSEKKAKNLIPRPTAMVSSMSCPVLPRLGSNQQMECRSRKSFSPSDHYRRSPSPSFSDPSPAFLPKEARMASPSSSKKSNKLKRLLSFKWKRRRSI